MAIVWAGRTADGKLYGWRLRRDVLEIVEKRSGVAKTIMKISVQELRSAYTGVVISGSTVGQKSDALP